MSEPIVDAADSSGDWICDVMLTPWPICAPLIKFQEQIAVAGKLQVRRHDILEFNAGHVVVDTIQEREQRMVG